MIIKIYLVKATPFRLYTFLKRHQSPIEIILDRKTALTLFARPKFRIYTIQNDLAINNKKAML